jgi:hypothetical protein
MGPFRDYLWKHLGHSLSYVIHKDYLRGYIGFISTIKKIGFFIGKFSPKYPI